jgi:pimeloyl-ACP methyl ester carboxylesterase
MTLAPVGRVVVAVLSLATTAACDAGGARESSSTPTTVAPTTVTASTSPPSTPSNFAVTPCRFENRTGFRADCGDLTVPEDRSDPDSGMIELHVAVFPALAASPAADPLVYLDGGPGGETLERISDFFGDLFLPFLQDRDVVIFDQRGVGFSDPSLACPEIRELSKELLDDDLSVEDVFVLEREALEACRDRLLADDVDLSAYNSAASAADVADLRRALGYERWDLLGVSYGSRLALTIMRDDPEGVRAVVLDSTYPPHEDPVDGPARFDRSLDLLFASCAGDEVCGVEHPELRERFFALADRLEADPVVITIFDLSDGTPREMLLDGTTLIELVFEGLYSAQVIRLLPLAIDEIDAGIYPTITAIASGVFNQREAFAYGMHFSVQCHEEYPFTTPDQYAASVAPYPELSEYFLANPFFGADALELCEVWPAGFGGDIENQPVASDLPSLVLAGQFDPITPPSWGRSVADTLSNSYFYEFPSIGHGATFEHDCPRSIAVEFLQDPTTEPDSSCITSIGPVDFVS